MIYRFPSDYFYGGKVVDDPSLVVGRRQEFHSAPSFRPVVFFDVKPGKACLSMISRRGYRI